MDKNSFEMEQNRTNRGYIPPADTYDIEVNGYRDLGALLQGVIAQNWDSPACTEYQGPTMTYGEMAQQVAWLHMVFEAAGLQKGDKVALLSKNSTNWAITFIAILAYGAVVVPVLHEFKTAIVHHIVGHSDSKLLFVGDPIWENLNEVEMPGLAGIFSLTDWRLLHDGTGGPLRLRLATLRQQFKTRYPQGVRPSDLHYHPGRGEELAVISYTSGTTGFSKGVMLPYRCLLSNLQFAWTNVPLQAGDPVICILPMAHVYGQAFEFLNSIAHGCHLHFLTRMPTPKVIVRAFAEVRPRIIMLVPLILEKIYKTRILQELRRPKVKLLMSLPILDRQVKKRFHDALNELFGEEFYEVIVGGAGLNGHVEAFLRDVGFRFTVGYGMTECGPIITYADWRDTRPYSTGRAVVNMEVRIGGADPATGVGEIEVRGANVMLGYYKNEQATRETFTPDGWLRTGDLATMDADGYIYIKGRSKNMILGPSGQNIYPEEIEGLLNTLPYVQEALVVDDDGRLVALVVPDFGLLDAHGIAGQAVEELLEEYRNQVNHELPQYSQLARVQLYPEEFEKTPKKSIKRFLYRLDGRG